jgi:predicted DNA-binding mobile mystery protein A
MGFDHETARRHLDARFNKVDRDALKRPQKGWIRAIRDALGMTTTQLAKRLGVSHPRILTMEKDEALGNLKLSTLERAADALGCELVYALIPRQELESVVKLQALKKAKALLQQADYTMQLEDQPSSKADDAYQLEALVQELLKGSQARLWDDF